MGIAGMGMVDVVDMENVVDMGMVVMVDMDTDVVMDMEAMVMVVMAVTMTMIITMEADTVGMVTTDEVTMTTKLSKHSITRGEAGQ